jgi:hypothetical protein
MTTQGTHATGPVILYHQWGHKSIGLGKTRRCGSSGRATCFVSSNSCPPQKRLSPTEKQKAQYRPLEGTEKPCPSSELQWPLLCDLPLVVQKTVPSTLQRGGLPVFQVVQLLSLHCWPLCFCSSLFYFCESWTSIVGKAWPSSLLSFEGPVFRGLAFYPVSIQDWAPVSTPYSSQCNRQMQDSGCFVSSVLLFEIPCEKTVVGYKLSVQVKNPATPEPGCHVGTVRFTLFWPWSIGVLHPVASVKLRGHDHPQQPAPPSLAVHSSRTTIEPLLGFEAAATARPWFTI